MSMQLSGQAEERLGKSALGIITERGDDVALLIGQMVTMGLPEVLDRPIPRHGKQRERSWGWTAVMWLADILTEGAHRQVSVDTYITGRHHTLSQRTGQIIAPLDCSDDRLGHLRTHVSTTTSWHQIERDLNARRIAVYTLPQDVLRCDATTVSGAHEVTAEGLWQCGQSKDDPRRPHITVMMGSLDPLGMPLSTDVLSGERAEDGVDVPIMERMRTGLSTTGLLCVGDGQMSAGATRIHGVGHHDFDLSPLPLTGETAAAMAAWITEGVAQGEAGELERIIRTNERGHEGLAAEGDACERSCCAQDGDAEWTERVVVVRSPMHAQQQGAGLEKRLAHAQTTLAALTPPSGRGTRQITDEATLLEAMNNVLKDHRVAGVLRIAWEQQVERTTQYVGRGRGAASRQRRVIETSRDHMTRLARQADTIAERTQRCGWQACVTNAVQTRLSLQEAVLCSRNAYRVERLFNRLKSRGPSAPLFVTLNDHIEGRTYLRTLGIRVLTVMECVLRRSLQTEQATLPGLHQENKHKMADTPTAERLLKAFSDVALPIIKNAAGEDILRRMTPLSGVQEAILQRLGLGTHLYRQLAIQNMRS